MNSSCRTKSGRQPIKTGVPVIYRDCLLWLAGVMLYAGNMATAQSTEGHRVIHVATTGSDGNPGSLRRPLKTVMAAATQAMPGDTVMIHRGIYRERIDPPRGGLSPGQMIWYMAAPGERVEIKGSAVAKGWHKVKGNVWKVSVANTIFKGFNPYSDTIHGDWLERGGWSHTGALYLNDHALVEAGSLEQVMVTDRKGDTAHWFARVTDKHTIIWADFPGVNPNIELVEMNVRRSVFYPSKTGINYIGVEGLIMSQAATNWVPPTAEQIGLIGTNWSRGWVIEKNIIRHSKCVGITLGKYGDDWDNKSESVGGYIQAIRRAWANGWDKDHVGSHRVRGNEISDCGQAGIAGSLGAVYSTIEDNAIHDISHQRLFWGYEMAGIKLHGAVDVLIRHNHIYRTEGGIWLDWMAQGTRVTHNLLHDNRVQDLSLEVNHGPVIIDNNIFLSGQLAQVRLSQGVAFIHNLISWDLWPTGKTDPRKTPYLKPHSTIISGFHDNPTGDARYYNNIFIGKTDLRVYDSALLPVQMKGNVFFMDTKPSAVEKDAVVMHGCDPDIHIKENNGHWFMYMNPAKLWHKTSSTEVITSEMLGMAIIPHQDFSGTDGQIVIFNKDYLDQKRDRHPRPGPFEMTGVRLQKIMVW